MVELKDVQAQQGRTKDASTDSEPFAQAILNGLTSHVTVLDREGTIIYVNAAWRAFAEANPPITTNVCEGANYLTVCDAAAGRNSEEADPFAEAIRGVLAGALDKFEMEYPCHSPEEERWFIGRVTRIVGDGPPRAIVAHENITERKRMEELLERYDYTIAHELKAPLSNIIGAAALIAEELHDAPDDIRQLVEHIETYSHRANDLVAQLLLLATVRDVVKVVTDVEAGPAIQEALHRFESQIAERGIAVDVAPDLPSMRGYGPWVAEVFANLIENAIKYIGADNPHPRIAVRGERYGERVRYEVQDNGVGIDPDHQAQVFGRFSRFHHRMAEGSGLGLSIVRQIVIRLDGEVGVESVPESGSTFWFTLPTPD
jgi:signal transduction histidine kinase